MPIWARADFLTKMCMANRRVHICLIIQAQRKGHVHKLHRHRSNGLGRLPSLTPGPLNSHGADVFSDLPHMFKIID